MSNKEKLLDQIKTVENLEDILNCWSFQADTRRCIQWLRIWFWVLRQSQRSLQRAWCYWFPQQFEEYIQEFYAAEEKEQKAVAEWFHNFSEQKQKKKTQTTTKNGVIVPADPPASLNPITASELDKKEIKPIEVACKQDFTYRVAVTICTTEKL